MVNPLFREESEQERRRAEAETLADGYVVHVEQPEPPNRTAFRDQVGATVRDTDPNLVATRADRVRPIVRPKQLSGEEPCWPPKRPDADHT